ALQGYVVEVACWVRVLEVDGRGQDLVAQGERAGDRLEGAGRAEQVAGHRLGGGDGQLVGVGAERLADGLGLGRVAERGAGAVGVDVAHLIGTDPGRAERVVEHGDHPAALRGRGGG